MMDRSSGFLPRIADNDPDDRYEPLQGTSVERSDTASLKGFVQLFPAEISCLSELGFSLRSPRAIFHENSRSCTERCAVLQMVPIQIGSTSDQRRQRSDPLDRIRSCQDRKHSLEF